MYVWSFYFKLTNVKVLNANAEINVYDIYVNILFE